MTLRMSNDDWQSVLKVFAGLWPARVSKLGDEEIRLWQYRLQNFPREHVESALRDHYLTDRFFPALPVIAARVQAKSVPEVAVDEAREKAAAQEREERDISQRWREVDEAIAKLTDAELMGHAVRIVAAQPGGAPLLGLSNPRQSRGLKAKVAERMREEIGPFEDFAVVRKQPTDRTERMKPVNEWSVEIKALTEDQIKAAELLVEHFSKQPTAPADPASALAKALPVVPAEATP